MSYDFFSKERMEQMEEVKRCIDAIKSWDKDYEILYFLDDDKIMESGNNKGFHDSILITLDRDLDFPKIIENLKIVKELMDDLYNYIHYQSKP